MDETHHSAETIQVNGESEELAGRTLVGLLEDHGVETQGRGVAIAVNGAVVPRAAWQTLKLVPGDAIEIVHAKQGG